MQQANQQPTQRFFAGVPFSVYAAPNQLSLGSHSLPGQQVQGTFSPSVGSGLLDSDDDQASDNSFEPSNDNDNDKREDDDTDFREESMDEKEPMKEMEFKHQDDMKDAKTTTVLGELPSLNESLSFDFE